VSATRPADMRRVLIVDDHDGWRRSLQLMLLRGAVWQIVGEASDGVEAIEKVDTLRPDLILMDVGLPRLNGIEATRQILERDAASKILFLSAYGLWDVAEAALTTGAHGYVLKMDASQQLARAMEIVAEGGRFVSPRLGGRSVEQRRDEHVDQASRCHEMVVESDEVTLVERYALFAQEAFDAGDAFILMTSDKRATQVDRLLHSRGIDIEGARTRSTYISLDVNDGLATCLVDGWPDETRVWSASTSLFMRAASRLKTDHLRVTACGDCSPLLLRHGKPDAAIRLERLWDDLCRTFNVRALCGYASPGVEHAEAFQKICEIHSAVHMP